MHDKKKNIATLPTIPWKQEFYRPMSFRWEFVLEESWKEDKGHKQQLEVPNWNHDSYLWKWIDIIAAWVDLKEQSSVLSELSLAYCWSIWNLLISLRPTQKLNNNIKNNIWFHLRLQLIHLESEESRVVDAYGAGAAFSWGNLVEERFTPTLTANKKYSTMGTMYDNQLKKLFPECRTSMVA